MSLSATGIHDHLDHGHTGGQHHRYCHQLPTEQEDFERCKPGKTTGLQQVVMVEQEGLMRQCSQDSTAQAAATSSQGHSTRARRGRWVRSLALWGSVRCSTGIMFPFP